MPVIACVSRKFDAAEAQRSGLVNRVFVGYEAMLSAVTATIRETAANSPVAVALCKATGTPSAPSTLRRGDSGPRSRVRTCDASAFLAMRPAVFPGR